VQALVLHPTAQASPLYRALGFADSGELIRIDATAAPFSARAST
jgi:hypothetical protein